MKPNNKLISRICSLSLIITFFIACSVNGQELMKVDLHKTEDFSDLKTFGKAIADKRIVYLDELTHGEYEVFALKSRLVKYLHQHHNFDALIIESGLFDVNETVKTASISKGKPIAEQASGNIFFAYAKDPAFLNLMSYIDSQRQTDNPLALSGFDGRLSGEYSVQYFVKKLEKSIQSIPNSEKYLTDWAQYAKQLQATLIRNPGILTEDQVDQHIQKGYQIMDALIAADDAPKFESPSYYARLLEGVIRLFEVDHQTRRFDEHDLVMANNIHWLLEHIYTDKKIIVWGHYVHVNRQGYLAHRANNVTKALSKAYGEQSYIVNFAGMSGQYREFRDGSVKKLQPLSKQHLANKLMDTFATTPHAIFIEPKQFTDPIYQDLMLYGHEYRPEHNIPVHLWRNHFDGAFYINRVTASN